MSIDHVISRLANILLGLFVLFTVLPVKLGFSSVTIIALTLLAIVDFLWTKNRSKGNHKTIFLMSIPILIYSLGLFNTTNLDNGWSYVIRNASFLAFPIVFYRFGNRVNYKRLFTIFLLGLAVTNLYLVYLFFYYFNFGERFYKIVILEIYHSTYLGIYNVVAYWICITQFKKERRYYVFSVFFIVSSVLASARIVFLIAFASLLVSMFLFVKSKMTRLLMLVFLILMTTGTLLFVPSIKQKFEQLIEIKQLGFDSDNYESISSRFGKIEASLDLIQENFLIGTGTGDLVDELVVVYEEMGFTMGVKFKYNPHNQFLDNLARNGILGGGIALVAIYFLPFYLSLNKGDLLLRAFILIFSCASFTESLLTVHKGITFYTFFVAALSTKAMLGSKNQLSLTVDRKEGVEHR